MPNNVIQFYARSVTALQNSAARVPGSVLGGILNPAQSVLVPVLLPRLTDADLVLQDIPQEFKQITTDTLGNAVTSGDGWEENIAEPIAAFSEDVAGIGDLLQHVVDADFVDGEFVSSTYTPITETVSTFQDNGDKILSDFESVFLPPDPTPITPPGPGSSGGPPDGPPNPGPQPTCDPTIQPDFCPVLPPGPT